MRVFHWCIIHRNQKEKNPSSLKTHFKAYSNLTLYMVLRKRKKKWQSISIVPFLYVYMCLQKNKGLAMSLYLSVFLKINLSSSLLSWRNLKFLKKKVTVRETALKSKASLLAEKLFSRSLPINTSFLIERRYIFQTYFSQCLNTE